MTFKVIDKKTGKEADEYEIALKEDWAKDLMYCDMEGFALLQDGTLILVDECGRFEYCPADRFEIVFEEERPQGEWNNDELRLIGDAVDYLLGAELLEENGWTKEDIETLEGISKRVSGADMRGGTE